MDIATYDKQRRESPNSPTQVRLRVYLLGVGEGLRLANAALARQDQRPLYCMTEQAPLLGDDYKKLIDAALSSGRGTFERQDTAIETILVQALQDKFPCAPKASSG